MEYLLAILKDLLQDNEQVHTIFVGMVTLAGFGFAAAIMMLLGSATSPVRRRLQEIGGRPQKPSAGDRLARSIAPVSHYILPAKESERSQIREKLVHAGFRNPNALTIFYSVKLLVALGLPTIVLLLAPLFPELETSSIVLATMTASAIGVMSPNIFLRRAVARRQKALRNGFPDALDLLVVCVEAGLGLAAAIQRVAEEMALSHPELADDMLLVTTEIRAGIDNVSALKNLAVRTGLDDIRGLVTLLAQSLRFGTSIADTLRVYSEEFRDKRMQAAEEQAAKIGTKLIFPLVTCLFPAFFVVTIGPAVLKVLAAVGRI